MRRRTLLILTLLASLTVFAVVQDRVTANGARRYAAQARAAVAAGEPPQTVDAVMQPAIRDGVRRGAFWGGLVLLVGLAASRTVGRR